MAQALHCVSNAVLASPTKQLFEKEYAFFPQRKVLMSPPRPVEEPPKKTKVRKKVIKTAKKIEAFVPMDSEAHLQRFSTRSAFNPHTRVNPRVFLPSLESPALSQGSGIPRVKQENSPKKTSNGEIGPLI